MAVLDVLWRIAAVLLAIGAAILAGSFKSKTDAWQPNCTIPPHLVYDRESIIEARTAAQLVRGAALQSPKAGHPLDNVTADVAALRVLAPKIKRAHDVRNALTTFLSGRPTTRLVSQPECESNGSNNTGDYDKCDR